MSQITVKANKPQLKFLSLPHKFRAFVAGYGTGKTIVGCMSQCIHYLQNPQVNQGYFAPTYPQIRDIFYPTIEEVSTMFGLDVDIKESNKEVHFTRGREYYGTTICRSMDRPHSIVGFKIGRAMIDELDVLSDSKATESWNKIIARLRWKGEGVTNGIDVTTTPEGYKTTYRLFDKNVKANPHLRETYGLVQASTHDNAHHLPDGYISSLIDAYPSELISAYINGQFTNLTTGTVYKSFNRLTHDSKETIQKKEPLNIGMDFNVGKMAAKVFVIRKDEWHCVEEIHDILDTPDMITEIKGRFPGHPVFIYPDASGDSRKTNDASTSDIALLEQAGFRVRANAANPRVKNRIMSVNKRFELNKLFVNVNKCPRTADDLEQQAYDKNGEPDKTNDTDHGNDAFGYPIAYTFPIYKPVLQSQFTFTG